MMAWRSQRSSPWRFPRAVILWVAAFAASAFHGLVAQDSLGSIEGTVVAQDGGTPLPFSTITVDAGPAVFSDSVGRFRVDRLLPGTHRVRIRELGFAPHDTTIDVMAGSSGAPVHLALRWVPHRLPAVAVRAHRDCLIPGLADSALSPELATIAIALRANGERLRLLLAQYPFEYAVEAHLQSRRGKQGPIESDEVDTLVYASWVQHPYRIGHVVDYWFAGRRRNDQYPGPYTYLPGLQDLADSTFQAAHCFVYAGEDTVAGAPALRIEFSPLRTIRSPDVEGSVLLDADRFIVRRATFRLTHPERVSPPLHSLSAETRYRELVPLVAVEDSVVATRTWGSFQPEGEWTGLEEDRVVAVRFRPTGKP